MGTYLASYTVSGLSMAERCSPSISVAASGDSSSEPLVASALGDSLSPAEHLWSGSNLTLFFRSMSSYMRRRSSNSRSGNLRLRWRGMRVAGTQDAPERMHLAQGNLRSHLTLRCWQSTHARTRRRLEGSTGDEVLCSGVGDAEDMVKGGGGVGALIGATPGTLATEWFYGRWKGNSRNRDVSQCRLDGKKNKDVSLDAKKVIGARARRAD